MKSDEASRILELDAENFIKNVWRMNEQSGKYELIRIDWTDLELPNGNEWHIDRFIKTIEGGGKVIGCFEEEGSLIAYASVNAGVFGKKERYVLLDQLFVSKPYRGSSIGSKLLELCKKEAIGFGAEKLYICAGSSENTIAFYKKNAAVFASEIDEELYREDPNDIQLEIRLKA